MIYTITLNPTLDRTLWTNKIQPNESNRVELEQRYAGGKGIDVSNAATTLSPGTALCQKDDFLKLVSRIKVQTIKTKN